MSKLDNIILECAIKVLDNKEEKLGDYVDPTKQQIKDLVLEIIGEPTWLDESKNEWTRSLRRVIGEL